MKDNDQISSYLTNFLTYSRQLDWDDAGERYFFKKGLISRIPDHTAEMVWEKFWMAPRLLPRKLMIVIGHENEGRAPRARVPNSSYKKEFYLPRTSKAASSVVEAKPVARCLIDVRLTLGTLLVKIRLLLRRRTKTNLDKIVNTEGKLTVSKKQAHRRRVSAITAPGLTRSRLVPFAHKRFRQELRRRNPKTLHLCFFGHKAYVQVRKDARTHLQPYSRPCVFLWVWLCHWNEDLALLRSSHPQGRCKSR